MCQESWKELSLWIMAPRREEICRNPTAPFGFATILIASTTRLAIWIVFSCTCFDIALTKPSVTRMPIISHWATITAVRVTRTVVCTSVMFYPTFTHALGIMITLCYALKNEGIANVFTIQLIFRISKNPKTPVVTNLTGYLRAFVGWWFGCHSRRQRSCCTRNNFIQI